MTKMDIKSGLVIHAKPEGQSTDDFGKTVGTVECLNDSYIKLKSNSPDGKPHWIPVGWVDKADNKAVYLNKTSEQFRREQLNELPLGGIQRAV